MGIILFTGTGQPRVAVGTEADWFATTDTGAMLDALVGADARKLRQFASECWHRARPNSEATELVRVYQRYLNGEVSGSEWFETYYAFQGKGAIQDLIAPEPLEAARIMTGFARSMSGWFVEPAFGAVDRPDEAALLREIIGNPFRPPYFDSDWQTDTVATLAQLMYDAGEFSAMPILADALQDAGCDNDDILTHCRDTSLTHVRGCWVLDLVLGRD